MDITILGCGASSGVPVIGCNCATCTSESPKNKRLRASIYIEEGPLKLLVDAGPDLRQQALAHGINGVNAVFFTHAHADHTHGIDELRSFNYHTGGKLPCITNRVTMNELKERFGYCFEEPIPDFGWFRPALTPVLVEAGKTAEAHGVKLTTFAQTHGTFIDQKEPYITLGLRIGDFAYSTDARELPEESLAALEGVKLWVVDCLRMKEAPTHAHLEQSLEWIRRVKPKLALLTHMSHELEYDQLRKLLPEGVLPAYDGLRISLDNL